VTYLASVFACLVTLGPRSRVAYKCHRTKNYFSDTNYEHDLYSFLSSVTKAWQDMETYTFATSRQLDFPVCVKM